MLYCKQPEKMKTCGYCGRENEDVAMYCLECGTPLVNSPPCELPVSDEEKTWIEDSLQWFLNEFGAKLFLSRHVILPEQSFFPDRYKGTEECVKKLVRRICYYMNVDPEGIEISFLSQPEDLAAKHRAGMDREERGAAGLYYHGTDSRPKPTIAINESQLKQPMSLVATIAHELGHVILLGGQRISRDREDHEYLTDLITVFLGLGIFTANSAFTFSQWQDHSHQGWRASRQGYMSEEMFAYALACCAWMRNDLKPDWTKHLSTNVRAYFKDSLKYFSKGGKTNLQVPRA